MKKIIPKDINSYTNITPDQLSSRALTAKEEKAIINFIKKYNRHHKKGIFLTISMGLAFAFLSIYNGIFDFAVLVGCSICFIIAFAISRKLLPPVSSCHHMQTGQLHGVWSLRNNSSHSKIYYFDVIFPDSKTRIRNVNCIKSEYSAVSQNDTILVFSFDGKTSYGCFKLLLFIHFKWNFC